MKEPFRFQTYRKAVPSSSFVSVLPPPGTFPYHPTTWLPHRPLPLTGPARSVVARVTESIGNPAATTAAGQLRASQGETGQPLR